MASTSVQSRISEFEFISTAGSSSTRAYPKFSPLNTAIANNRNNTSLLEAPLSPTALSLAPIVPQTTPPRKSKACKPPSPSPPGLGRSTSLIDLKDWVVDDGPVTKTIENGRTSTQNGFDTAPLINLESPPKPKPKPKSLAIDKAPPLPPRKPSHTSLKHTSSPIPTKPHRSDSLTVGAIHTYPPLSKHRTANNGQSADGALKTGMGFGHAPASSISSFHSVSLSSDGGNSTDHDPSTPGSASSNFIATFPVERTEYHSQSLHGPGISAASNLSSYQVIKGNETGSSANSATSNSNSNSSNTNPKWTGSEGDAVSLDESFENVSGSTTSLGSPATTASIALDWERAMAKTKGTLYAPYRVPYTARSPPFTSRSPGPPKLPQRPASTAIANKSSIQGKSPMPPPPPRSLPTSPKIRPISSTSSNSSSASVSGSLTETVIVNVGGGSLRRKPPPPVPPSSFHQPPSSASVSPPSSRPSSMDSRPPSDRSSILSNASITTNTSFGSFVGVHHPIPNPGKSQQLQNQLLTQQYPVLSPKDSKIGNQARRASSGKTSKLLSRPTPIPAAARARYEGVFVGNVMQARKTYNPVGGMMEKVEVKRAVTEKSEPDMVRPSLDVPAPRKASKRQAAGWRGLSVDLITNPLEGEQQGESSCSLEGEDEGTSFNTSRSSHDYARGPESDIHGSKEPDEEEWEDIGFGRASKRVPIQVDDDTRLDGYIIKKIWSRSRLGRERLREIWIECDPMQTGSLTCEDFVRGMWRIDEELRKRARMRV